MDALLGAVESFGVSGRRMSSAVAVLAAHAQKAVLEATALQMSRPEFILHVFRSSRSRHCDTSRDRCVPTNVSMAKCYYCGSIRLKAQRPT
jgi:hypothetical protein